MSHKDNLTCDFVCEWFDFLRTWINNEADNREEDDGYGPRTGSTKQLNYSCYKDSNIYDDENMPDDVSESGDGHSQPSSTNVTCFNCDVNYLFFGTNTGWLYCFSRGERQAKGPLYEHHPIRSNIIGIEIPDENVVSLLLPNGFVLFNFVQNEIIYSWSVQRPNDELNFSSMVTSKCIYDDTRHRYHVFTGDSTGKIRCHNVIEDETETIFNEEEEEVKDEEDANHSHENFIIDNHRHKIVQIDAYSSDLLLVSSCFRSLILWKSVSDSWSAIQIGRNVRKVCGQYGAVFHPDGNIVIASRPAMHLIKANTTDGSVTETFKLKNAKPLRSLNLFREPVQTEENHLPNKLRTSSSLSRASSLSLFSSSSPFNLGSLIPIRINKEDYVCSWNSHSLFIVNLNGTLLMKEYSSVKIIGANVSHCKGFLDIIVLREDWTLFRIRFVVKKEYNKSKATDYGIGDVLKVKLGNQHLLTLPGQALNSLEGEIKKIYSIMQDKIYESGEKLLTYTSFDNLNVLRRNSLSENRSNSDKDECLVNSFETSSSNGQTIDQDNFDDENLDCPTSPLYIHKNISAKNSRSDTHSDTSDENVLFSRNLPLLKSSPSSNNQSTENLETSNECGKDINLNDQDSPRALTSPTNSVHIDAEDESSNQSARRKPSHSVVNLEGLELTKKFHQQNASSYASEIKTTMIREGDNIFNNIEFSDSMFDEEPPSDQVDCIPTSIDVFPTSSTNSKPIHSSSEEISENATSLPANEPIFQIRESRPIKHVDWHLVIESTHDSGQLRINRFCASGYSDQESSSYVWLSCLSKGRPKLVYYPDFDSVRPPPGNSKRFTIGAIRNKIYLLDEENKIWFREGADEPGLALGPLGTLATRWTNISTSRLTRINFIDLSLCSSDLIGWFCDINGDVWLSKLRTNSWTKISHDPDNLFHIKSVRVCPTDSSMVWCIDVTSRLFVRAGIFNTRGDSDEHICGMAWLPVHTPVQVSSIAVTNKSVWILSIQGNRIFKRIGIQPPSSYVGTDWQEIRPPTLVKDSLKAVSASLNGDIWILTEQGSIWQICDP